MIFHRRIATLLTVCGALVAAASCSKGGTTPTTIPTMTKVAGDNQVSAAGAALATSLSVQVKDQNGAPMSGVVVSWAASSGGGTVAAPSSSTDGTGTATMSRTLGPAAGFQTTTASLSGATGSPITFTSISQIGGAFQVAGTAGGGQSDTVLATLGTPFQFTVTDHTGAPVAGVVVSFAASGGGLLTAGADTSDAGGHVTTQLTLPATIGSDTIRATVTGLVGSPAVLAATAVSGHATLVALSAGDHQVGATGTPLGTPLAVVVHDAHGNVASGVTVAWGVSGGGSVSAPTTLSNAAGIASVTRTLGGSAGVGHDTATAAGLTGSPVIFSDTAAALFDIAIHDDFYQPQHDTVALGSFVRFTWTGAIGHSVTWDGAPDVTPIGAGVQITGTLMVRLTDLGKYSFHCLVHGSPGAGMFGDIVTQ